MTDTQARELPTVALVDALLSHPDSLVRECARRLEDMDDAAAWPNWLAEDGI